MLRITDVRETMPDGGVVWTLKLEGNIQGEWVNELRRAWRAVRLAAAGASIRLVLADVQLVDTAGKVLLTEMHRDGVGILATDSLTGAIRDEVVDGALTSPSPTHSKK
jgi:ABC-type transporter Mla MlaB component